MRGIPGSGKSTYARRVMKKFKGIFKKEATICSADHFFIGKDGIYKYDRENIGLAHAVCQRNVVSFMSKGFDLIILDNTNTIKKELNPYIEMANKYGYTIRYKIVGGQSEEDIKKYAARNIHGVNEETIKKMAQRLASSLKLKEI